MTTIPNAPNGENTTPDGSEQIPLSGSKFIQILNLIVRKIRETGGPTTLTMGAVSDGQYLKRSGTTIVGVTNAAKGIAIPLVSNVPATLGAPVGVIADGSSPVGNFLYFEFADAAIAYRDITFRLVGYGGGGLTVNFEVLRTSASAGTAYVFQAAIRRILAGTEDITASHTYDYNNVTVTIPAGPPAAGIPMQGTITFTDGADMDSLGNNEIFELRFRRDPTNGSDNAGDTARVLATISVRET